MSLIEDFGALKDGRKIERITLSNDVASVSILTFGAILQSFVAYGRNVVVSSDSVQVYEGISNGKVVGPFANRIKNGQFSLNGKTYQLDRNNGQNSLHSGSANFGNHVWDIRSLDDNSVTLHTCHKAMDGGIPANIEFDVIYELDNATLRIIYKAIADDDTIINPTNHVFFNLHDRNQQILDHVVRMNADRFIDVDDELIPISVSSVKNTDFDFETPHTIGERRGGFYDHCFVFKARPECIVSSDGYSLIVNTDRPAMQMYTGKALSVDCSPRGKIGSYCGVALETSGYPDAVNHPEYPSTWLKKGEQFESWTTYTVKKN